MLRPVALLCPDTQTEERTTDEAGNVREGGERGRERGESQPGLQCGFKAKGRAFLGHRTDAKKRMDPSKQTTLWMKCEDENMDAVGGLRVRMQTG